MSLKHDVKPFSVDIPNADLDDLMTRLKRTRFLEDFGNDHWRYGHNTAYHRELINYWINEDDWRDVERAGRDLLRRADAMAEGPGFRDFGLHGWLDRHQHRPASPPLSPAGSPYRAG